MKNWIKKHPRAAFWTGAVLFCLMFLMYWMRQNSIAAAVEGTLTDEPRDGGAVISDFYTMQLTGKEAEAYGLLRERLDEKQGGIVEFPEKLSGEKLKGTPKLPVGDDWGEVGELKNLNVIIKGDVQGSVEAVKQSVLKLTNDEVQIKVIHSAAGAVNESDVMLAESSKAIILAFNVRPDPKAKALAERSKVDVRTYRIIYDLLDEMELAMKGMRTPKYQDIFLGKCEVRQTFKITGVGNIAGCYVLDGKIIRGGKLRIYRDNILIVEGGVKQLKRFKDDVKEVAAGFECGCAIEGFNDIKIGDIIECYLIEEVKA